MIETADVIVIGAGIIGAACADALSAEGLRVIIVESNCVSGGTTGAGMGHIVVMDDSEAQFALTNYSRELWNRVAPEMPRQVEFDPCGTIWVAADEGEMDSVHQKLAFYSARGVRAETLSAGALLDAEPNLRLGLAGGLLIVDDSVIYAPCAVQWLLERAQRRGAVLQMDSAVVDVTSQGVRLQNGTHIYASSVVCAMGTWTASLFPEVAVRPRKGHLVITDRYDGFVKHQLVELGYLKSAHGSANESVAFNVQPRSTGQVLIGSSRQYNATDSAVDAAIASQMLKRAFEYMPALAGLSAIRTWTGFRPATDDNLPVIGPCPDRRNVYLATGHEGLGITTSLATAELIRFHITGRSCPIEVEPYLPGRRGTPVHA